MLFNDTLNWVDYLGLAVSEARSAATDAAYARDKARLGIVAKDLVDLVARIGEAAERCEDVQPYEAEVAEKGRQFELLYSRLRNNPSGLHDFSLEHQIPPFLLGAYHSDQYWNTMEAHYGAASTFFQVEAEKWGYYANVARNVQTTATVASLAAGGVGAYIQGGKTLALKYGGRVVGGFLIGQATAPLKDSVRAKLGINEQQQFFFDIGMQVLDLLARSGKGPRLGVNGNPNASHVTPPVQPTRAAMSTPQWTLGQGKSATKWANQMKKRGWTEQQITEALESKGIPARNVVSAGNPATRHVHPETGKSVVIDNKTGEIIHVGGEGFDYSDWDL